MRRLIVVKGPNHGLAMAVRDTAITVGHHASRDLVLKDDRVSRLHARIQRRGNETLLTDEGSTNGTFVNGALVKSAVLHHGDMVVIGKTWLRYEDEAEAQQLAAQAPAAEREGPRPAKERATTAVMASSSATTQVVEPPPGQKPECDVLSVLHEVMEDVKPLADRQRIEVCLAASSATLAAVDASLLYRVLTAALAVCVEAGAGGRSISRVLELSVEAADDGRVRVAATYPEPQPMRFALNDALNSGELQAALPELHAASAEFAVGGEDSAMGELFTILLLAR